MSEGSAEVEEAGRVAVSGGRRWLVTSRDLEWLTWLGRWRFATAQQISDHFEDLGQSAPVRVVERRMRAARELGLVESERVLHEVMSVHWLTRDGMRLVGLTGAVTRPKVAEFRHDLTVTDVARWWAHERPEWELVTEREIRREETPNQFQPAPAKWSVALPEFGAKARRVYPDLVTVSPDGNVFALELEFSRKEHRRLVRLMTAYAASDTVTGAVYFASANVFVHVAAAAEEANRLSVERGRGKRIRVQEWPPPRAGHAASSGEHPTRIGQDQGGAL